MSLRSNCTNRYRLAIAIGALCTALLAAGCETITAEYPSPGQPIQARAGQALVFGHVKVIGTNGEVFFPVEHGLAKPSDRALVEHLKPVLWLSSLGSLIGGSSPNLKLEGDGSLSVWAPTGYYALVFMSPRRGGKYQMENVALIRVPGDAVAAYAGNLTMTIAMEPTATLLESQPYSVVDVRVTSNLAADTKALEARYGPLPAPPAESLWCAPSGAEGNAEEFDHAVAIAELNAGCTDFVTVPLPTAPRR